MVFGASFTPKNRNVGDVRRTRVEVVYDLHEKDSQSQVRIQGGPGGPGPPLTLGFEAPKLSIFGPYLIFP